MTFSDFLYIGGGFLLGIAFAIVAPALFYRRIDRVDVISHDADNLLCYERGYRRGQEEATARWLRNQADFKGQHVDSRDAYQAKHLMRINRIA